MSLPKYRQGNSIGFHAYPSVEVASTIGEPEAVVWSSIRHLCSRGVAEDVAASIHRISRKRDRKALGRNLKLYVQQASEFYEAARGAKPNTAPLIYYYSFLNLAKAVCELRQPMFHRRPECYKHGLTWRPDPKSLVDPAKETVSITTRGVWHSLWEALTESACPAHNPTKLRVRELFRYCPAIAIECRHCLGRQFLLMQLQSPETLADFSAKEVWLKFSIHRDDFRAYRFPATAMNSQIRTPRSGYIEVASEADGYRTFQTQQPVKVQQGQNASFVIHPDISALNLFTYPSREGNLQYFIPIQRSLPLLMPQLMVDYTILFWLGSLVRYDPHSVDALMDSGYWMLIDGFMSQSRLWMLELFEWAFYKAETTLGRSR